MTHNAIFLDRDGTLIKEKHYLHKPSNIEIEKNVVSGLKLLQNAGYFLFIITNQSGIGRGYFTVKDFQDTQAHLINLLAKDGITIKQTYHCPHDPSENCACRKPMPGMLTQAIQDFDLNPQNSFMIGDKQVDIDAGHKANLQSILVRTGYGEENPDSKPDYIANDILDAAENFILKNDT